MAKVKFVDIQIDQIYATRGGTAVLSKSGKVVGWGYDRVRIIEKTNTQLVIETPWGTSCSLDTDYPLSETNAVDLRTEFKLITTYVSKQEIPFDDAVAQGICTDNAPISNIPVDLDLQNLIQYFSTPKSISSAAQKFGKTYQKIRYLIRKLDNIEKFDIIRQDNLGGKTIHIVEVINGKST